MEELKENREDFKNKFYVNLWTRCTHVIRIFTKILAVYTRIYKLEGILMLGGDLKSASNFKDFL